MHVSLCVWIRFVPREFSITPMAFPCSHFADSAFLATPTFLPNVTNGRDL